MFNEVNHRSLPGDRAQGEEPPVVRRAAGAQHARGDGRPRRARGARARWDGSRSCSATAADWSAVRDRLSRVFGVGELRAGRPGAARRRRIAAAILRDLGGTTPSIVPRVGAPGRQALSADLAARSSARSAAGSRKRAAGTVDLGASRADDPRRGADRRGVLLLRQGSAAPAACRSASSGRVACLLSGGIDSPVAAWRMMRRGCRVLFVHFHSYPILSRASQEKARELVRDADALPVLARGCCSCRSASSSSRSCSTVPPPLRVVIYRRLMMRIAERSRSAPRAGAGHRRGRRPGRVADAREPDGDQRRRDAAGAAAAHRHGQGRDHRRGAAPRHVSDLDHPRPGLLHALHAQASGDQGARRRQRSNTRRESSAAGRGDRSRRRSTVAVREDFSLPVIE